MNDYFADYFNLLKVNLDYENEISLQIAKDRDTVIPIIKYLGTDKQAETKLKQPKSQIKIVRGATSRDKVVELAD